MGIVRLRLARFGRIKRPSYRLVATDSRAKRDGKFIERLGYYDPLPGKDGEKRISINFERVKYWLSVGAQPSDTVKYLLYKGGMLGGPSDELIIDPVTGRPVPLEKGLKKISDIKDDSSVWEQL